MPFTLSRSCTINHLQVPSTQTNFPVLVNITDNCFKTTGNGGNTTNVNGYDIRPYSDSGLNPSSALTYELERFNAATGEVIMWVLISSLSSASDTVFYLDSGNSSLTTDGSSTTTWTNSFLAVYHLKNGSSLSLASATGLHDGTVAGTNPTATVGQIDGAAAFSGTQFFLTDNGMNPAAVTYSSWVNATVFANAYNSSHARTDASFNTFLFVKSNGKLACGMSATTQILYDGTGSHTLSPGTWYYLAMTYDSTNGLVGYVNGESDGTAAANGTLNTNSIEMDVGRDPTTANRLWTGSLDEVRVASVARSADWITCEYRNQKTGSTFLTFDRNICGLYTK